MVCALCAACASQYDVYRLWKPSGEEEGGSDDDMEVEVVGGAGGGVGLGWVGGRVLGQTEGVLMRYG